MFENDLIKISEVLVRPEIAKIEFSCNIEKCKGACCTLESDYGAPLLENELKEITDILERAKKHISEKSREIIEEHGFFEKKEGEYLTRSIGNKDCVFVYFENKVAKCSIEKVYFEEGTSFRKPISCHLFPIRISNFRGDILRYEKFEECNPALEKGKENKVKLLDFCKDALIRLYGKQWFSELKEKNG